MACSSLSTATFRSPLYLGISGGLDESRHLLGHGRHHVVRVLRRQRRLGGNRLSIAPQEKRKPQKEFPPGRPDPLPGAFPPRNAVLPLNPEGRKSRQDLLRRAIPGSGGRPEEAQRQPAAEQEPAPLFQPLLSCRTGWKETPTISRSTKAIPPNVQQATPNARSRPFLPGGNLTHTS